MTGLVLLRPREAAQVLGLRSTKNVARNAERHGLTVRRTPFGHRRYDAAEIDALAVLRAALALARGWGR